MRRGRGKIKNCENTVDKNKVSSSLILGNNLAGLISKQDSFNQCLSSLSLLVFFAQECKTSRKNKIKVDEYVMFEKIRKDKGGGGLMTAIHKSFLQ